MRIRRLATLTAILGSLGAAVAGAEEARPTVGRVDKVERSAHAKFDGDSRSLVETAPVLRHDMLATGDDARLEATLADGTKLTLGENGEMLVDDFVYDPEAGNGRLALKVARGAFLFVGGETERTERTMVSIETPMATLGVRGTTVWGGYLDGFYSIIVLDGEVEVTTAGGSRTLRAGQATEIVAPGRRPLEPHAWKQPKIARAVRTISFDAP